MPQSLVGRVGRWCARHAWWVLGAWLLAVAAGVLATGPLFSRLADGGVPRDVESVAAYDVIRSGDDSAGTVVGVVDRVDPDSPRVREAIQAAAGRIAGLDGVREVDHPYSTSTLSQTSISTDGIALLVSVTLDRLDRTARDAAVRAISAELHRLADDLPTGAVVEVGGAPALNMQTRAAVQDDLSRAEYTSLPITLIVLVLVFGGVVAAGLPVLTAAVSVAVAWVSCWDSRPSPTSIRTA